MGVLRELLWTTMFKLNRGRISRVNKIDILTIDSSARDDKSSCSGLFSNKCAQINVSKCLGDEEKRFQRSDEVKPGCFLFKLCSNSV